MDKTFNPSVVEPRWRDRWQQMKLGVADASADTETFVVALPPPNITGRLHLGHACGSSIQDALARYHRMLGHTVEWAPGTDHAAIATNAVIERQLAAEGTTKEALGREHFHARVDAWYEEYGGYILEQMRNLGFSCDWSRTRFTLDASYELAIRTVFKSLYDSGLIYRGPRIVNWCPQCRSAISDEEVDWQEHTDTLTHLRYPIEEGGEVVIATVRPETMLGDTAVAVAPGDARYTALIGKTVRLPLVDRLIPIIEDSAVKPEFGSGALKVTPAHDLTDYEIGERHQLARIGVIAEDGTMDVPELPQFHGMPAGRARAEVTEALRQLGAVVKEEPYVHEVGHCDRCGHVLEPLISAQWWVAMKQLAEPGIAAVEDGSVRFHPRRYADVYLDWMHNIRDWCISRQIWLGHRIPVSECANGHRFAWIEPPIVCSDCSSTSLTHDPDVLDTWFSSALWPFAIFGWPDKTQDFERFYPTNVLVTARDIIPLWVARMIMAGLRFTDRVPFSDVIITSTIQAKDGSRMSKSKGNAVDPQEMIDRYGADAVRAWAGAVGTSGQDIRFDEERIQSYQRFANKLWNVTRFLVSRLGDENERIAAAHEVSVESLAPEDRWMLWRINEAVTAVDSAINAYRFHDAMERLYETTWHSFCDWYAEMVKPRLEESADPASRAAAAWTLTTALDTLLRLLHPFMPFVTEECAQHIGGASESLQRRRWPTADHRFSLPEPGVDAVLVLVQAVRTARQEAGQRPHWKQRDRLSLEAAPESLSREECVRLLEALDPITVVTELGTAEPLRVVAGGLQAGLVLHAGTTADDTERLQRQLVQASEQVQRLQVQLANPRFVDGAPEAVVAETRRRLQQELEQQDTLRRLLGEDAS